MVLALFFILCVMVFCLHICLGTTCMLGAHGGQKRAAYPLGLELEMVVLPRGCWESNPCPLGEQPVLLTPAPGKSFRCEHETAGPLSGRCVSCGPASPPDEKLLEPHSPPPLCGFFFCQLDIT